MYQNYLEVAQQLISQSTAEAATVKLQIKIIHFSHSDESSLFMVKYNQLRWLMEYQQ